ncbi:MAG: YbaB/EbfC family nucleoid-associated protein [Acidobacteriota bacterium]|nr:YbaB/EbfC family nucleoid-associated protein [Blastocatellia bacterium]MDW8412731.1 YbaB/EbfC family nucleoid-associated protein [Acidobacteriota bacterium]
MKFPGFNPGQLQQMMKDVQRQQEELQKRLRDIRVEASAGGGIVTVTVSGLKEMVALRIDPDAIKDGDVEMLQDLIVAATNEANRKADEKAQEAMRAQLGMLGLGGLF